MARVLEIEGNKYVEQDNGVLVPYVEPVSPPVVTKDKTPAAPAQVNPAAAPASPPAVSDDDRVLFFAHNGGEGGVPFADKAARCQCAVCVRCTAAGV